MLAGQSRNSALQGSNQDSRLLTSDHISLREVTSLVLRMTASIRLPKRAG